MSDAKTPAHRELATCFTHIRDGDRRKLDGLIALGDAAHPDNCPWRATAATLIGRRLESLMGIFSFELLAAIQHGELDARAVAESVIAAERTPKPKGKTDEETWQLLRWECVSLDVKKILSRIAASVLEVPTLTGRQWDSLDIHSVRVQHLRRALLAAYLHGDEGPTPS